jgi:aspartyl-tRNA(Asn)/glutamyl-tRNA(Gln) amidotransferase subunit A
MDWLLSPDQKYPPIFRVLRGMFEELAEPVMRDAMQGLKPIGGGEYGGSYEWAVPPAGFSEVLVRHRHIMAVEAAEYHQPRLRRHPDDYPPRIRGLIEEGLSCPATTYSRSRTHQYELAHELEQSFRGGQWITPATTGPAPSAATTGDPAFNSPWSYTGLPTVSLPFARTPDGLPLAIQVVGWRGSEARLLASAAWCEEAIGLERREVTLQ